MQQFNVPILFIIFNRPEKTRRVFEAIRKVRPEQLFIAADGPRDNKPGEEKLCDAVRAIIKNVDWPCQVSTRFQEKNLGCKFNASGAVTWFFEHVEEGIIVEDDCLPIPSFFPFCKELLEQYRDNKQVMHISGSNPLTESEVGNITSSYYFSRCAQLWGWATWRRAWQDYDISMKDLDILVKKQGIEKLFLKKKYLKFWIKLCKHVRNKNIDTWDAQWQYTIMNKNGYIVIPRTNLIENIGFDHDATHTKGSNHPHVQVAETETLLRHPTAIEVDKEIDARLMEKMFIKSLWKRVLLKLKQL